MATKIRVGTIIQAYGFPMISGFKGENFYKVVGIKDSKVLFRRCNELGDVGNLALGTFSADAKTVADAVRSVAGGISSNGLMIWKEDMIKEMIRTDKHDSELKLLKNKLAKTFNAIEAVNVIDGTPKQYMFIFSDQGQAQDFSKKWKGTGKESYKYDTITVNNYGGEKFYSVAFNQIVSENVVTESESPLYTDWDEFVNPDYIVIKLKTGKSIRVARSNKAGAKKVYQAILYALDNNKTQFVNTLINHMAKNLGSPIQEARGVGSIQKDYSKVLTEIETNLATYKKAKGTPKATAIVSKLKELNARKKELESELDSKVSGLYKDVELKAETVQRAMIKRIVAEQLGVMRRNGTLSEMGVNDSISKQILRMYKGGTASQKKFISITLTAKQKASDKEIEAALRDVNTEDAIDMAKKLNIN